jgi:hypothetical protein
MAVVAAAAAVELVLYVIRLAVRDYRRNNQYSARSVDRAPLDIEKVRQSHIANQQKSTDRCVGVVVDRHAFCLLTCP